MSDATTYHAELVEYEVDAGGWAHIQACWVEDHRFMFSTIVHQSRIGALRNGMLITVRGGAIRGEPQPLPA